MDMSYLKDMPIAVLGGGAVGKTMAADCALAGKEVRIWDQPRFAKTNFLNIEKTGITFRATSSASLVTLAKERPKLPLQPMTWQKLSRVLASSSWQLLLSLTKASSVN